MSPATGSLIEHSTYVATDHGIEIKALPYYIPERSHQGHFQYLFGYQILMNNTNSFAVALTHRTWIIRDGKGMEQSVRGEGVVGTCPILRPGEKFSYQSFCPLSTSTGSMRGHFDFHTLCFKEHPLRVSIPMFFLRTEDCPKKKTGLYAQTGPLIRH